MKKAQHPLTEYCASTKPRIPNPFYLIFFAHLAF